MLLLPPTHSTPAQGWSSNYPARIAAKGALKNTQLAAVNYPESVEGSQPEMIGRRFKISD